MSSKQGKNIKGELKIEGNLILSGITKDDSPLKILYYIIMILIYNKK